jgi:hypothetical protein
MAISRGPKIITNGLVLALDAADTNSYVSGSTSWYDLSGNNYTHTLTNAPLTTFQNVSCFNMSTTGYAKRTSATYTFTTNYTLIAWANALSDSQVATWRTLWRTQPDDHPLLIQDATDTIGYFDNNFANFVSYGATLNGLGLSNKWTMFVVTGTGGSSYFYYNNAIYVGSVSYGLNGLTHDAIGSTAGATQPFGYVATATIYNRVLSTAEILQNYNATKSRFGL